MKKTWYLIAYDIRHPKRLRKIHYILRKQAFALQQSVHAVHTTETALGELLNQLEQQINRQEDDLRIWPIAHPGDLWYLGNYHWEGKLRRDQPPTTAKPGIRQRLKQLFS